MADRLFPSPLTLPDRVSESTIKWHIIDPPQHRKAEPPAQSLSAFCRDSVSQTAEGGNGWQRIGLEQTDYPEKALVSHSTKAHAYVVLAHRQAGWDILPLTLFSRSPNAQVKPGSQLMNSSGTEAKDVRVVTIQLTAYTLMTQLLLFE